MNSNNQGRRSFLQKAFAFAGVSTLSASVLGNSAAALPATKTVEFVTRFPKAMTLSEYRGSKNSFENKDKVQTLITTFKKTKKMLSEEFSFHGDHSVWRVTFNSEDSYQDWMNLTKELQSHSNSNRKTAGFFLEIRALS